MPATLVPSAFFALTTMLPLVPGARSPARTVPEQEVALEQNTPLNTSLPLLSTKRVPLFTVEKPVPVTSTDEFAPPKAGVKVVTVGIALVVACAPSSAVATMVTVATPISRRNTRFMP
jgi:hypothetical protein